jgi:hypothetical protein
VIEDATGRQKKKGHPEHAADGGHEGPSSQPGKLTAQLWPRSERGARKSTHQRYNVRDVGR